MRMFCFKPTSRTENGLILPKMPPNPPSRPAVSHTTLQLLHKNHSNRLELIPGSGIVLTTGGISEVCGTAGCGKTQIALALCVRSLFRLDPYIIHQRHTTIPNHHNDNSHDSINSHPDEDFNRIGKKVRVAMYISTSGEGPIPHSRIEQFVQHCYDTIPKTSNSTNINTTKMLLQRVLTRTVHTIDDLMEFVIHRKLELSFQEYELGVLVIDSIGGLFRGEYNENMVSLSNQRFNKEGAERAGVLFSLAAHLKKLSSEFNFPVVTVNQVSADFSSSNTNTFKEKVKAALGLSWSCCVNSRYLLTRTEVRAVSHTGDKKVHQGSTQSYPVNQQAHRKSMMNPYRKRPLENEVRNTQISSPNEDDIQTTLSLSSKTYFHRHLHIIFSPILPSDTYVEYRIEKGGVFLIH